MPEVLRKHLVQFRHRIAQMKGKFRRLLLCAFRKKYVETQTGSRRHGECARCGQCCKLVFRCPFLKQEGPRTRCTIYGHRLSQCKQFPIDERDVREVAPTSCGYRF